jgi:hypothetical protein
MDLQNGHTCKGKMEIGKFQSSFSGGNLWHWAAGSIEKWQKSSTLAPQIDQNWMVPRMKQAI